MFMTNDPTDGSLLHVGDVVEFPKFLGDPMVKDGRLAVVPDSVAVGRVPLIPSKIIGINITQEEYERGERVAAQREQVTGTPAALQAAAV